MSNQRVRPFLAVIAACALLQAAAFAESHVRIVRLSYIEGGVQIDRNAGQGFEKAMPNLPVTEGSKLRTAGDGRAEVEFENGSTLRVASGTSVEFQQLSLQDSGVRSSVVFVRKGMAYVDFVGSKSDEFSVRFGDETAKLVSPAHFRLDVNEKGAELAVFKGQVKVEGKSGEVEVEKNRTAKFGLADNARYTIAKNVEPDPFDDWDKQQNKYHQQYVAKNSYSPYSYGTSDLAYYGSFTILPGYGLCWQPYFASAAWDPFMDGMWAFYPGFGYTWVSSYPWGWMPYRYGNWAFVPGFGWAWQPGRTWTGWNPVTPVVNPPNGFRPLQPPSTGQGTIAVTRPLPIPAPVRGGNTLVIRNGSAGLGVPRGSLHNLAKVSNEVTTRGPVTMTFRPAPTPMTGTSRNMSTPSSAGPGRGNSAPSSNNPPMATPRSTPSSAPVSAPRSMPSSGPAASGGRR